MTQRIVIGDCQALSARVMQFLFEDEGYAVVIAKCGRQVVEDVSSQETALVILDVTLPDLSGFDVVQELRACHYRGPCVLISGSDELTDKVRGFGCGADEYIVKPYEPVELLARVRSVLRRYQQGDRPGLGAILQVGDAELSIGTFTYRSEVVKQVSMTPTEMRLLEMLMRHAQRVIPRETLVERLWRDTIPEAGKHPEGNHVDVYIRRVRRKIEPDPAHPQYLQTIRGVGYVFTSPSIASSKTGPARPEQILMRRKECPHDMLQN